MKKEFLPFVARFDNLHQIFLIVNGILLKTYWSSNSLDSRIGFVSGLITSDGPEYWEKNMKILDAHTKRIRSTVSFPVFSAADIFTCDHLRRIDALIPPENRREMWCLFWRGVLKGPFITDIFFTPRWEQSAGARDEFYTAQRMRLTIHNPA